MLKVPPSKQQAKCPYCSKILSRKTHLDSHIKTVHPDIVQQPKNVSSPSGVKKGLLHSFFAPKAPTAKKSKPEGTQATVVAEENNEETLNAQLPTSGTSERIQNSQKQEDEVISNTPTVDSETLLSYTEDEMETWNNVATSYLNRTSASEMDLQSVECVIQEMNSSECAKFWRRRCSIAPCDTFMDWMPIDTNAEKTLPMFLQHDFKPVRSLMDGNCLYNAISFVLFEDQTYNAALRFTTLYELIDNKEKLKKLFNDLNCPDEEYIQVVNATRKLNSFACNWAAFLISDVIGRPITFLEGINAETTKEQMLNSRRHTYHCSVDYPKPSLGHIYIIYDRLHAHFVPLLAKRNGVEPILVQVDFGNHISYKYIYSKNSGTMMPRHVTPPITNTVASSAISWTASSEHANDAMSVGSSIQSTQEKKEMDAENMSLDDGMDNSLGGWSNSRRCDSDFATKKDVDLIYMAVSDTQKCINKIMEEVHFINQSAKTGDKQNQARVIEEKEREHREVCTLITSARSVDEILDLCPDYEKEYLKEGEVITTTIKGLKCTICFDENKGSAVGYCSLGLNKEKFDKSEKLPRPFVNAKQKVLNHLASSEHKNKIASRERDHKMYKSQKEKLYSIGLAVGHTAYTTIKLRCSYEDFEMRMAQLNAIGLDIGDINHSSEFIRSMVPNFYEVLKTRFFEVLNAPLNSTGRPTPFCVVADKYTPAKHTLQVIGIIAYVNGSLRCFNLNLNKISSFTGLALANNIHSSLLEHYDAQEIRTRLVGAAFDGQYLLCNVKDHMMEAMEVPREQQEWYTFMWDPAHLIELACEKGLTDSQKRGRQVVKTPTWVSVNIINAINLVNDSVKNGQSFDDFLIISDGNAKKTLSFSKTRFSTYCYRSLENFIDNYPYLYDYLNATQDSTLNEINNAAFVLGLTGLNDIYGIVHHLSEYVQAVNVYPWRLYKEINSTLSILEAIQLDLETVDKYSIHNMYSLESAWEGLLGENPKYKGKPILICKSFTTVTRAATETQAEQSSLADVGTRVKTELAKFIKKLLEELRLKLQKYKPVMVDKMQNVFSLEAVVASFNDESIPCDYGGLVKQAMSVGSFGIVGSEREFYSKMTSQYHAFCMRIVEELKGQEITEVKEMSIYSRLLNAKDDCTQFKDVMHLLLCNMVRSSSEAPAEGMGSVVKQRLSGRSQLLPQNLEMELFIQYNGPPPLSCAIAFIERSLDSRFGSRDDWHFMRSSKPYKLQSWAVSAVVDRINKENLPKFKF